MKSLLAILAVAAICTATAQTNCASFGQCLTCTAVFPCGWCPQTGGCSNGTQSGPSQGSCPTWTWTPSMCSAPGSSSSGSGSGSGSTAAPSDPCNQFSGTCMLCTQQGSCGYCQTTSVCQTGGSTGPVQGFCPQWAWTQNQCMINTPAPANVCGQFTSCNTCTLNGPCGWCPSSMSCRQGTAQGPNVGTCPNWQWTVNLCMTPMPSPNPAQCATNTMCTNCTMHGGCGWCVATKSCSAGSASGPAFGSCAAWSWTEVQCPSPFAAAAKKGQIQQGHLFKKL